MEEKFIKIVGAKEHNLKNIDIEIPKNKLVVITGLSGSGKSSLAFDTIYAEGQRRYVESLSSYARQFLDLQDKPDVESISGLSPAIAIDQKTTSKNPRSTVGTVTEIYDYMRLLYSRIGIPYSPATGKPIKSQSPSEIVERILNLPEKTKIYLLAPFIKGEKGEHRKEIINIKKQGFHRIKIDDVIFELDEFPKIDKNKKHDIEIIVDRIIVGNNLGNRLADSVETALKLADGLIYVEIVDLPHDIEGNPVEEINGYKKGQKLVFSEKFSCPKSGFSIAEIEPRLFSFNSPYGSCHVCGGLGTEVYFDPELVVANKSISLKEGAIDVWNNFQSKIYMQTIEAVAKHYGFSIDTPFRELGETVKNIIFYGSKDDIQMSYYDGYRTYNVKKAFKGVINEMIDKWEKSDNDWVREELVKYQNLKKCETCEGYRLSKEALCIKIDNLHIGEVSRKSVFESIDWFRSLKDKLDNRESQIAERVLKEIDKRLEFLRDVGLDYLTLDRESGTLSGGESQRIRLASQIGSGLSGVMYVLDEPSIGLHPSDNDKLIKTLKTLRNLGNTVIVVEHDDETMRASDYLIDMGPGAGVYGGNIIAKGLPKEVIENKDSITGKYLKGELAIPVPKKRRTVKQDNMISIRNARTNNLKNLNVSIPLGVFCAVTGVSGGGKSSLIIHTLYKALNRIINNAKVTPGPYDKIEGTINVDKVIQIDQSPIGRTPRSNPCTYIGAFTPIRELFTNMPESKSRGYKLGRFSFNVKGGRCETCQGDGMIRIEMHFLPDVYIMCDSCGGKRYNRETLEIKYRGKSVSDILDMNSKEAMSFFKNMTHIYQKFKSLCDVGLTYMKIGQSATTLSGGEAQRIKLAKELSKKATGNTLYILDEPTTGLHADDIRKLLAVLHKLVNNGNTVIVIEHNLDVIKTADWVIDIGPKGGDKGGQIVFEGTPEEMVKDKKSVTGKYLSRNLKPAA